MKRLATLSIPVVCLCLAVGCSYNSKTGWKWGLDDSASSSAADDTNQASPRPPASSGPIAMWPVTVSRDLGKTIDAAELDRLWRAEFQGIRFASDDKVRKAIKDEEKGRYKFWTLGGATRVKMGLTTTTGWRSLQGKLVNATFLVAWASVGDKDNPAKFRLEGKAVGLDGKVWPSSTILQNNADLLRQLAAKVKAEIR